MVGVERDFENTHTAPWIWSASLGIRPLGNFGGSAQDINDLGQVIGTTFFGPYVWQNGILRALSGGNPVAINNRSEIAGFSTSQDAVVWRNYVPYDLLSLLVPGSGYTRLFLVRDINDAGQIICFGTKNGVNNPVLLTPIRIQKVLPTPASGANAFSP